MSRFLPLLFAIAPLPSLASTNTVNASGGANYTTISAALSAAASGDTILVQDSATYSAQLKWNSGTASPVYIMATNPTKPIISASQPIDIETANKTMTISGFNIQGGATFAIFMSNDGSPVNINVTLISNVISSTTMALRNASPNCTINVTNCVFQVTGGTFVFDLEGGGQLNAYNSCISGTSSRLVLGNNANYTSTWVNCIFEGNPTSDGYFINGGKQSFYNCTFADDDTTGNMLDRSGAPATIFVTNCIFYKGAYGIGGTGATISEDYNIFYGQGSGAISGGSLNSHDKTTDPLFTSAATYDFHLTNSSPAIDAGTTIVSITTDYDGNNRLFGVSQDMGAFEYGSSPAYQAPSSQGTVFLIR